MHRSTSAAVALAASVVVSLLGAGLTAAGPAAAARRPALAGPSSTSPAQPTPAVASVLARARSALAGVTRVHLDGAMSEVVQGTGVFVSAAVNAGASYGTLSETISSGGRKVSFGALLTPSMGYCTGNPDALTAGCALAPAQAFAAEGHWLAFPPGTAPYRAVASSVLFGAQLAGLLPASAAHFALLSGGSAQSAERSAGLHGAGSGPRGPLVALRGPAAGDSGFPPGTQEVLELAARGPAFPAAASFALAGRVSAVERFSRWGKRFTVAVPAHPLALAALR